MTKKQKIVTILGSVCASLSILAICSTIPIMINKDTLKYTSTTNSKLLLSNNDLEKIYTSLADIKNNVLNKDDETLEINNKLNSIETFELLKKSIVNASENAEKFVEIIQNVKFKIESLKYETFHVELILDLTKEGFTFEIEENNFFALNGNILITKQPISYGDKIIIEQPENIINSISNYLTPKTEQEKTYAHLNELITNKEKINTLINEINNILNFNDGNKLVDIKFEKNQNGDYINTLNITFTLTFNNYINSNSVENIFVINNLNKMEISSKNPFEFKNLYYEYDEEPIISITKLETNLRDQHYNDVNDAISKLSNVEEIQNIVTPSMISKFSNLKLVEGTSVSINVGNSITLLLVFDNGFYTKIITFCS